MKKLTRDRITTTDEEGRRIPVFPASVSGYWKNRRFILQWVLILFYLVAPWVRVHGHPLILIDIVHRRFSLFGSLFFPEEVPNLLFIALSFVFFFGLMTLLFGRVWCGWACPQTVFIERVFRTLEQWIEGDPIAQKKLYLQGFSFKKVLKWVLFFVIALILSHSFLAYFVGSHESFAMMKTSPFENPRSFVIVAFFVFIILFDFGWFREQFCLIACPYGRFQSVLLDSASLTVAYNSNRKDCIECGKCIRACPTGIDIRNGLQMECISCTACIDACDEIMDKVKKPRGLIGYYNAFTLIGKHTPWIRWRAVVYGVVLVTLLMGFAWKMSHRNLTYVEARRAVDSPFQVVKESEQEYVINHFKISFQNRSWDPLSVQVKKDPYLISPDLTQIEKIMLQSGEIRDTQFFLKIPRQVFEKMQDRTYFLNVIWSNGEEHSLKLHVIGPSYAF